MSAARAQAAASGRYRPIADRQQTGCMSLPLSIDGTDRRTLRRMLCGQRQQVAAVLTATGRIAVVT